MKHNIFIGFGLMAFLALACCKSSISVKDLQPKNTFTVKLPHIIPILEVYPTAGNPVLVNLKTGLDSIMRQPALLPPLLDSMETRHIRNTYYQDANAPELLVYFAKDIDRNMTRTDGPVKGYISCRINALETPQTGSGLTGLHGLTLGSMLVIGVPHHIARASIEIEVVVRDNKLQPIKRYWGMAETKKYSGLYYGYRMNEMQRACTLEAFKNAFQSVKNQMAMDQPYLEQVLN